MRALRPGYPRLLLVAWLAASAFGVATTGRFFAHYHGGLLPALTLLVVPLVERAKLEGWWSGAGGARPALFLALSLVAAAPALLGNGRVYIQPSVDARHEARYRNDRGDTDVVTREVGAYVASMTGPDDRVFNFGRESQIYFYADREPAGRFFYDRPFWLDRATLDEQMAALAADPPALILVTAQIPLPAPRRGITEQVGEFYYPPALAALLRGRYDHLGRVGHAEVYRLTSTRAADPDFAAPMELR